MYIMFFKAHLFLTYSWASCLLQGRTWDMLLKGKLLVTQVGDVIHSLNSSDWIALYVNLTLDIVYIFSRRIYLFCEKVTSWTYIEFEFSVRNEDVYICIWRVILWTDFYD